jgi:hypothetical protein
LRRLLVACGVIRMFPWLSILKRVKSRVVTSTTIIFPSNFLPALVISSANTLSPLALFWSVSRVLFAPLYLGGNKDSITGMLQLTKSPSVEVGLLIRRPPLTVFEALADPSVTVRFWYTKSSGSMVEGSELLWEWEMYGVSSKIRVTEVRAQWDG